MSTSFTPKGRNVLIESSLKSGIFELVNRALAMNQARHKVEGEEAHLFRRRDEGLAGELLGGEDEVILLGFQGLPEYDGVEMGDPTSAGGKLSHRIHVTKAVRGRQAPLRTRHRLAGRHPQTITPRSGRRGRRGREGEQAPQQGTALRQLCLRDPNYNCIIIIKNITKI